MRKFPKNKTIKQKLLINVCYDYYGKGMFPNEKVRAGQIALYLMGKRRGIELTNQEKSDMWAIKENLKDKIYLNAFRE